MDVKASLWNCVEKTDLASARLRRDLPDQGDEQQRGDFG
jgi:hypothetical protein